MEAKPPSKVKRYVLPVAVFVIGAVLGAGLVYEIKPTTVLSSSQALRENNDKYTFIHPLLVVNRTDTADPTPAYAGLVKKIEAYIADQKKASAADDVSVYFIDYGKASGSFGINADERYSPASLLKVVVMVAYLKKSDGDPALLNRKLTYAVDIASSLESVPFSSPTELKVGTAYTVSGLIDKMIADSDNGAMNLLIDNLDKTYLSQVYADLGLESPDDNSDYTISAKEYSLFFRILYNATYLSRESSEKALSILSKVTFADGLVKGLPEGMLIAHKFGEHINGEGDHIDSIELHDCGIVYPAGGPYLLCVMTKGQQLSSLDQTVAGISKMIYDDVSARQ